MDSESPALQIVVSPPIAPPILPSYDSKIYLSLFGEVIACDLNTLGPDPALIIQLLKATQSERANYMVVGAFYRRSGFPRSAKAVLETLLEGADQCILARGDDFHHFPLELAKRGVSDSELKPAYLFLSGCESDLARLSKAEKKNSTIIAAHYASAKMWLQKVFGKADADRDADKENNVPTDRDISNLKREVQSLRDRNAQQAKQLAQLRASKRKIEDDYYHERNLRRKYQDRIEALQDDRDAARRMERFALEQVKREASLRKGETLNKIGK